MTTPSTWEADEARYALAHRHSIGKVAYFLSELARDGRLITKDEAAEMHWALAELREVLDGATVGRLAPEVESEEEYLLRYESYNTYSDGTAVASVIRTPDSSADPLPPDFFDGSIDEQGPIPRGWKVVIADPPHRRGNR